MAYKKRSERKRASGGKVENLYNAEGSPAAKAITAKSDGFKKGGHVEGMKPRPNMAKRARGGSITSNGSPYSSARSLDAPGNAKGSPGEQAPTS